MSFGPINAQLQSLYSATPPPQPPSHHLNSDQPFDSSMALTVIILLAALFFMGFFSIYIRRFSTDPPPPDSLITSNNRRPAVRPSAGGCSRYKGLDPELIRSLPVYSYYRGEAKYQILECAICLGEFEEKENVKMIPYCKHVFHLDCIGTWLRMHVTCPVCRGTQFFVQSGGGAGDAPPERVEEQVRRSTVENGDTCIEVGEVCV
ncbi:RING-H2 finger protein ATL57 [Euphorbia lathyris]|uniref:RING-H2 finger protein ATL57 n=1 Tax=Euphorbia lathyris TaxID=212925 RepID=UPI003313E935